MPFETQFSHLVSAVEANGLRWRKASGIDGIIFQCPLHEDKNPSARMWCGNNGNAVIGCYSCNTKDNPDVRLRMIHALGLKLSHMFATDRHWDRDGNLLPDAVYEFFDENLKLSYRSCRYNRINHSTGQVNKTFSLERFENGSFIKGMGDTKHSLYLLPQWINQPREKTLFWTEGENKATLLNRLGLLATSMHGGSSQKYCGHFNNYLKDRHITFLPDCSEDSQSLVYNVSGILLLEGIAKSVRVTRIPCLQPKQDVWDWIQSRMMSGISESDIRKDLLKMVIECPSFVKTCRE